MANQYTKVPLYIDTNNDFDNNLSSKFTLALITSMEDILPKDIESIDIMIKKIEESF